MDIETYFASEIAVLKEKFPDKTDMIEDEIENAVNIYRYLRQDLSLSQFTDYEKNWIKRCVNELLSRDGDTTNVQSYSENDYSVSYFTDRLSQSLLREVFPKVNKIL